MRTPSRTLVAFLVGAAVAVVATPAAADAIAIPEVDCPDGSSLQANHSGHWCEPRRACAADTDCYAGEVCSPEATGVCFDSETYTVPTQVCCPPPVTAVRRVARGPCGPSCAAPSSCETTRRCMPAAPGPAPTAAPVSSGGGLCAIGARRGWNGLGLGVGLAAFVRRRGRRRG